MTTNQIETIDCVTYSIDKEMIYLEQDCDILEINITDIPSVVDGLTKIIHNRDEINVTENLIINIYEENDFIIDINIIGGDAIIMIPAIKIMYHTEKMTELYNSWMLD